MGWQQNPLKILFIACERRKKVEIDSCCGNYFAKFLSKPNFFHFHSAYFWNEKHFRQTMGNHRKWGMVCILTIHSIPSAEIGEAKKSAEIQTCDYSWDSRGWIKWVGWVNGAWIALNAIMDALLLFVSVSAYTIPFIKLYEGQTATGYRYIHGCSTLFITLTFLFRSSHTFPLSFLIFHRFLCIESTKKWARNTFIPFKINLGHQQEKELVERFIRSLFFAYQT